MSEKTILIAASSGVGIYAAGEGAQLRWEFRQLYSPNWQVGLFVLLLLGVITLGAAVALTIGTGNAWLGLSFFGVCLGFSLLAWWLSRKIWRMQQRPAAELPLIAGIDFATGDIFDGAGQVWGSLSEVVFRRRMQLASSSPKLVLAKAGGELLLLKGNPFAGGIASIRAKLLSIGLREG